MIEGSNQKKCTGVGERRPLAQLGGGGTVHGDLILFRRGGRAVDRAGLENRKAERPREFESHPLRVLAPAHTLTLARAR